MRRVVNLLLAFAVLWCGLHMAEVAEARTDVSADLAAAAQCAVQGNAADCDPHENEDKSSLVHACHHHCPVAPDARPVSIPAELPLSDAALFEAPILVLDSLSPTPPLQPPTA